MHASALPSPPSLQFVFAPPTPPPSPLGRSLRAAQRSNAGSRTESTGRGFRYFFMAVSAWLKEGGGKKEEEPLHRTGVCNIFNGGGSNPGRKRRTSLKGRGESLLYAFGVGFSLDQGGNETLQEGGSCGKIHIYIYPSMLHGRFSCDRSQALAKGKGET